MSLIVILFSNVEVWSGIRESNPPPRLGKPVHYRCANPALRADTRTRTGDPRITNALLYQLSHIGDCVCKGIAFFYIDKIFSKFFLEKICDNIMKV